MYKIEEKNYGFKLTFGRFVKAEEMQKLVEDFKKKQGSINGRFCGYERIKTIVKQSQNIYA